MSEEPQVETLETPSDHFTLAQEEEDSDMTADNIDQTSHLFLPFVKKPPTLEEALAPMGYEEPKNLAKSLITNAKEKQEEMDAPGLTVEDIAAIMCYTLEWDKERFGNAESPYRILNDSLSVNRRKGGIKKIRGFLFLLLQALRKLPRYIPKNHTLYRGIRTRVQTEVDPNFPERRPYAAGNEKTWWAFTSTTVKLDVTQLFLGRDMCTLFIVCGKPWGYDVSTFSNFPEEKEILLEPERRFRITNVIREGGLTTINATMLDTPLALETIIKVPKRLKDVKLKKIKIKEIPEGLKVEEDEDQSIKVSWSPVVVKKKTILYQLSMKKLGGLGNSTIIAYEGTEVECVIKKPEPERTYEFQVRCGYNGSLGKWSEKVSVKTKSTVSSEASPKPSSETNQEAEDKKNLVLVKLALMIMDSNKDSVDLEMYNTTMAFAIQVMNGHGKLNARFFFPK